MGLAAALAGVLMGGLAGCSRLHTKPTEQYVFVTAKQAFLRDRVAAVSNRTGEVANGDRLKVVGHARHFVQVQTDGGKTGWIEEKAVATPEVAAEFDGLKEAHKADAAIASAVVRDQVYLHVAPGRDAEKFYLLNEGDKLSLLKRATLEKASNPALVARAQKAIPQAAGSDAALHKGPLPVAVAGTEPAAPSFEDWWLVRSAAGQTGWIFARMIDVDAPDALTRYSEGQRFVGAYVLGTVYDAEAPQDDKNVPIYVTVLSPFKAGLPYDFNQVRVFTWSTAHHRYETGFRDKNIEGYLPVTVGKMKDVYGKGPLAAMDLPSFSYRVLDASAPEVVADPKTGAMVPGKTITKTYRLEGNLVRRMGAPGSTAGEDEAHPEVEEKKEKHGKKH